MKQNTYFLLFLFSFFAIKINSHAQDASNAHTAIKTVISKAVDTTPKEHIGLEVKPVRLDFNLSKGEAVIQTLNITNNFPFKMVFRAYTSDWLRDSVGVHQYLKPGTLDRSCAKWISFENNSVEIAPKETKQIIVKMKMPNTDSAMAQMKWCLVFLESVKENKIDKPSDSVRTSVNTIFRVGIHVLQTPPQLKSDKKLEMISFKSIANQRNNYQITCINKGETQLECKGYLELSSLADNTKKTVGPIMFPIFPDQKRLVNFSLPQDIPNGKYSILAVVDANDDDVPLQASEATVEIKQ
ncbi:MAG: hypothetical protein DI598_05110 [Pseudopedobacter saltans]|uniref:DUF916 domain-containing protein n=1 Tax=Pseudopedobacter saltans TaxID=151895 RepID=A0A2W5GXV2_9SPHI|nr:MAG: hypothetical protein DI598_05110 [Pseudopedobacter saltans]